LSLLIFKSPFYFEVFLKFLFGIVPIKLYGLESTLSQIIFYLSKKSLLFFKYFNIFLRDGLSFINSHFMRIYHQTSIKFISCAQDHLKSQPKGSECDMKGSIVQKTTFSVEFLYMPGFYTKLVMQCHKNSFLRRFSRKPASIWRSRFCI